MQRKLLLHQLAESFKITHRLFQARSQHRFAGQGLALAQLQILFPLKRYQPITPKELAHKLYLTPGAITQVVEALVQSGYVTRSPDLQDRRVVHLSVSGSGSHKLAELQKQYQTVLTEATIALSDQELTTLLQLQQKIIASLGTATSSNHAIASKESKHQTTPTAITHL